MTWSILSVISPPPLLVNESDPESPGLYFCLYEETKMGSKTQKTEIIRHRKHAPNKINRKAGQKEVRRNLDLLVKLENENRK